MIRLWLALLLAGTALAHDCQLLYASMGYEGLFRPYLGQRAGETDTATLYALGEGIAGGKVSRVVPKNPSEPTYISKAYKKKDSLERDLFLLNTFERAAETNSSVPTGFLLVKARPEKTTENGMRLEDVAGRDLHSLLRDPNTSYSLKEQLKEAYAEKVAQFQAFLKTTLGVESRLEMEFDPMYFRDEKPDGTGMLTANLPRGPPSGGNYGIKIKSDNVIVHYDSKEGDIRMSLTDPY